MVIVSMWKRSFHYCQAQPQLKPNWAKLLLIPMPPTADQLADRPTGQASRIVLFSLN